MFDGAAHSNAPPNKRTKQEAPKQNSTCSRTTWLQTLEIYVKNCGVDHLEFSGAKLEFEVLKSVLRFLEDSQVTVLVLENQEWSLSDGDMKCFCDLLLKTNITSLKIQKCNLSYEHLSTLIDTFKNSNIVEFDLIANPEDELSMNTKKMLLSSLRQSRLSSLKVQNISDGFGLLLKSLDGTALGSSLSCLNLSNFNDSSSVFTTFFQQLPRCSIKDLNLSNNKLDAYLIELLSKNINKSKIEKLNLSHNHIIDADLNILVRGLVDSQVIDLNLSWNQIYDITNFGECLKRTKVRVVNLSRNMIASCKGPMTSFPDFLKDSVVESLDLSMNHLTDSLGAKLIRSLKSTKLSTLNLRCIRSLEIQTVFAFSSVFKDTDLKNLDILFNKIPEEAFRLLCGCLKESKLESIQLEGPASLENFFNFWEGIKNSSIRSVNMRSLTLSTDHANLLAHSIGANIKHLNLSASQMDDDFMTAFAPLLKLTSIAHLHISSSNITDVDVQILAEHLKGTQVSELDLRYNKITCEGAKALGTHCRQTSLIRIDLSFNCIERTEDLDILAEYFSESLVVNLICHNRNLFGRNLHFDKILMENRILARDLVTFFKEISPESSNGNFYFQQCVNKQDVTSFLEKCLKFYKRALEPAAISTLFHEDSLQFSREELVTLMFESFPQQLVMFISEWIEADVTQHVAFLKRAEELELGKFVEILLLNRPLFMIDEAQGILHPFVYPLLMKYNLPICNEGVEPEGITKIVTYFSEHLDIEGSANVICVLLET